MVDDGTRVVRAGLPKFEQGAPFLPGPVFAGSYHLRGEPSTSPYTYGRYHNPTWTNFERAIGELEEGVAVAFSSGMAAVTAVMSVALLPPSSHGSRPVLVMPSDSYYTGRRLVEQHIAPLGVEVRYAQTAGDAQTGQLDGATLLWLESPTNPGLDVCDIRALVSVAHDKGALVAVDNTTPTPLDQKPLQIGADFSVSSDTKAISGHQDVILGHVAARQTSWGDKLRAFRTQQGSVPGPMEVWLAHRSLATLDVRLERQCRNALEIAMFLSRRKEVEFVRYPGLESDPAHKVASGQMRRFGPVVSFALKDEAAANEFLSACSLVDSATSFGSVRTSAERRARWGGDVVPPGFIRMSSGCEQTQDLLDDIGRALDKLGS